MNPNEQWQQAKAAMTIKTPATMAAMKAAWEAREAWAQSHSRKNRLNRIQRAAKRVRLAVRERKNIYGVPYLAMDEKATLRRVALFAWGSGRASLTQEERDDALEILRDRFQALEMRNAQNRAEAEDRFVR